MPIYAYKCASCGHSKDVLQKISDAPLTVCPACGAEAFSKQLTAAGFQLKGSGWYVTDFRGGSGGAAAPAPAADGKSETKTEAKTEAKSESKPSEGSTTPAKSDSTPSASAGGCGSTCACH